MFQIILSKIAFQTNSLFPSFTSQNDNQLKTKTKKIKLVWQIFIQEKIWIIRENSDWKPQMKSIMCKLFNCSMGYLHL